MQAFKREKLDSNESVWVQNWWKKQPFDGFFLIVGILVIVLWCKIRSFRYGYHVSQNLD